MVHGRGAGWPACRLGCSRCLVRSSLRRLGLGRLRRHGAGRLGRLRHGGRALGRAWMGWEQSVREAHHSLEPPGPDSACGQARRAGGDAATTARARGAAAASGRREATLLEACAPPGERRIRAAKGRPRSAHTDTWRGGPGRSEAWPSQDIWAAVIASARRTRELGQLLVLQRLHGLAAVLALASLQAADAQALTWNQPGADRRPPRGRTASQS